TSSSSSFSKKRKVRSKLFSEHLFSETDLPPEHPNAKTHREVICLTCLNGEKTWLRKIGDFNTSNLWRYLESHYPDKDLRRQDILEEFMNQSNSLPEFSQATFRKFLAQWVISDSQLFTTLENIHFHRLVKLLNLHALVPREDTIRNDIIKSFEEERRKLIILFQNIPGKISFAIDVWTLPNAYSFLAITAHWITNNWELKNILIDFIDLMGPHSGENLCNAFVRCCRELGILTKMFAITSDNATNNDTFMRCVQDILKNLKAGKAQIENNILNNINTSLNTGEIIPKLRKLIVNIRSSPQRRERFAYQAKAAGLKDKMREALDAITSLNKELKMFELNDNEWSKIKEI
ncbi:18398_t:CDS:2, partial [Racocetra persica]